MQQQGRSLMKNSRYLSQFFEQYSPGLEFHGPNRLIDLQCCGALKTDQPCAFKIDQGWMPGKRSLGVVGV
jgi:hypothetical protein